MEQKEKIPVSEKYGLSIEEAAEYFHIGQTKLRNIMSANPFAPYVLRSGGKVIVKRVAFEKFLDERNDV